MLLTNWLGTLTSHIKKRPLFRSRDRRAIRRRWNAAVNNQISTTEILEDRTLLTTAAPFSVDDVTPADAGNTSYSFTVQYSAEDLGQTVQPSSIDVDDVTVVGPGAIGNLIVTNAQVDFALGTELRATYTVTPPGGTWDVTDDGVYTININRIEVSSTQDPPNDFAPAGLLTTFNVDLAPNLAPMVTGNSASGVGAGEAGDTSYSFTVEYSDDSGIDVSTIGIADVTITGPGGALTVTSAVGDAGAQLTPKTVTYTVTPPGGDWDITDNGVYTISINASEVGDDDGPQLFVAADPSLTTFNVNVPSMAATLSSGNLEITQTNNPDSMLSLSVAGGILTVTDPGNTIGAPAGGTQVNPNTFTIPVASLTGGVINVTGGTGSDNLIVDTSVAAAGLRVVYEGGGGAGSDSLSLTGAAASVEHTFTNANDGGVLLSGANFITYTGLEPVDDAITATDRTFSFTGAAETITLSNFGTPGESLIDSTLGESVNFVNPTGTLTINTEALGGSGIDIVDIDGVDGAFAANLTVNAGTDDTINTGAVNIGAGILDLTGGQVNVNGAFIANGGVDIDSTLADITFAAAGSIDAGSNDIDLTATFNLESLKLITTSEVRVTATGGGINDLTANALITADRAALRAASGITGIDTDVNTLAASTTGGGFSIDNAGDLIIGTVDGLSGITANASTVFLSTTGQLTVSNEVSAATIGYLRAIDAAAGVQDIIVNADITTLGSALTLEAGDNLNVATGVTLSSAAALNLAIDFLPGGAPDAAGGVANLNGIFSAGGGQFITVTGGMNDDQVIIDGNGGGANDGGTVDGIQSNFTFNGMGGSDELVVDDSGDVSGDTIAIVNTLPGSGSVGGATTASLGYIGLEDLTVYTGSGSDDITVNPNALTAIDIRGGDPFAPASPGDTLTYNTPVGQSSTLTPSGADSGTIAATGGFQDVMFDEIETLNMAGSVTVNGTSDDDVLEITATGADSGFYQITTTPPGTPGPIINFTGITDFTFNGDDGDDILRINNPVGGLFNPTGGIFFNGQGQTAGDSLEILGGTATTVEHRFTNANDGTVHYEGNPVASITYTGLEPIIDNIDAANRIFSFTGAAETITLSDDGQIGDGESLIDSTLGESVNFVDPTGTLTINTDVNGAADQIDIDGVDSLFDAHLTVNPSAGDTINVATVDIGSGDLNLDGIVNFNGAFTTTGVIDIEADGDLTFAPGASAAAGFGGMILFTHMDMHLGLVTTPGDVELEATGFIADANMGANNIDAVNATLTAGTGAGVGDALETAIAALEADIGTGLELDNTGALNIGFVGGITGVMVGGLSTITSNGTMTVTENISASGGDLELENTGGNFVVNNGATISNDGNNLIDIDSANGMSMLAGSEITSSGTGLIDIDAVFQIALANVNTGGEVQITTTTGAITDNTGGEAALITANTVALRAATGIGVAGAGDIDLAINTLAADTTMGDIYISEPSLTTIGTVDMLSGVTAGGDINLDIGGTLNINDKIEATDAASLINVISDADINVNAIVQTNGGAIDLLADNHLNLLATSIVDTTTPATVTLTADADSMGGGAFTQFEGSVVGAQGGDIDVLGTGDVRIADLRSAGGTITVTATNGTIFDNTAGEAALISGGAGTEVALRAAFGIGANGASDIDTSVDTLAAVTTNNDIAVSNTGALEIGTVDTLVGVDAGDEVFISTASPLTVAANVTGAGAVTLTSTDAAGPGDDLTINGGGVTVESTGANVVLNSGDDFTLSLGGTVRAATTIDINVDPITNAAGATVDLLGNVDATQTNVNGGGDADIFNILPTSTSPITVNGGAPVLPGPGDVLNMDFSGLTNSPFLTLGVAPGSGAFGFVAPDIEQTVNYTSIENVTSAGAYHLVLDMFASGFQNGGADVIDAFLDGPGTNLILDINGPNFFTGAIADILSFTVVGSTDDETLNVNETAGGLPFFTEAAPVAVPGSAGSHLNAAATFFLDNTFGGAAPFTVDDITIHYDGGLGTDNINVNFTTDHNAAYFSDTDDGLGSGNIAAATTAGVDIDLGLSFAGLEGVGINGTTTGGGLHVDASSTPGTDNIQINDVGGAGDGVSQIIANGGFTNMVFSGFNDLEVLGGSGSELIDLIALDSTTTLTQIQLDADDVFGTNAADVDTIRVRTTPPGTVTDINILAADGDDLIEIFNNLTNSVNNIHAAITVDGEGGTDTLTIIDSGDGTGDTVEVTSTTVDGLSGTPGSDDVTFSNIDDLSVTTTGGNDIINVNMTTQEDLNNVVINGSDGDDVFNLQNDTPVGVDTRLNGDAGLDSFIFLASNVLRGFINGGGDRDTIDYSGYAPVVHVALSGLGAIDGFEGRENNGSILGTGAASLGFTNIDNLLGSAGPDTLEGPDLNNYWGITSNDAGRLIADRTNLNIGRPTTGADTTATPPEQLIDFTSFQNLIGGDMDDRFDLSDGVGLTGTLDGRLGNDSLDYRDYTGGIVVDLFAGTATNIAGGGVGGLLPGGGGGDDDNSIENVFGGDSNDNIVGDNDNNILGDGFGDDFLDGGGNGVGSENGGNDVFLMEPGAGGSTDVITDIHGNDTVDFRFASAGIVFDVDIINTPQDVFGGNTVELRQIQPQQPDTNPSFMENIVGSEFADLIFIDPLSQDGNFPIDGPPVLRSADGRGGVDTLDFDAKGQEVIDTGFSLTADGVGTVQYLNFENVVPFEDNPGFIVDNGDAAFSISGDWPFHPYGTASIANGTGFEDDIHFVPKRDLPAGNDLAEAFWEFYGLTPGDYRVSVTWPVSTNPGVTGQVATDSPFTVFDGSRSGIGTTSVPLATVDLNQQNAPDDYSVDGAVWETLGVFTITDRTMTVMLNNLANGYVIADAIRIERISTGPEVQLADVTDMLAPPALVVDGHPGGINFGSTELLTPAVRTFEITNQGSATLNISNVVEPTGFTVIGLPASIPAGNTVQFTIEMDASTFGDRSGIFSFDTDDVDEATFNILLQGSVSNVVVIDDGDLDFTATPGFESFTTGGNQGSLGYEGDVSGAIPNQPGNTPEPGTETATWTFTGLADGNYRVSTTWSPHWNRAEDAPYTLDGGAGSGAPIDVDQRGFPSSFVDENGVAWFDLDASFSVTGGVLTVSLTNDASSFARDNYDFANGVIADAVRIEYLPEPDIQVTVDGGTVVADDTGVVDFGSTLPGVPVIKTFRVENLSTDPVDVEGLIEFPPGFSIDPTSPFGTVPAPPPVTIPGGGFVEFTIQFDGGTTGSTSGQISFTTGDEDANPYNFNVLGEAGPSEVGITDPGFSTVGTWSGVTPGNVGDPVILYAGVYLVGGTGTNSATWEFDVEPGRYQIVGHWYSQPTVTIYGVGAASDAPFTIFDDAAIVTTIDINQQENTNEFLDDGVFWNYIGDPVEITSDTLRVQLTDDADGLVFADEIRIYRVVDPFITVEVDGGDVVDGGTVDFEETIVGAPVTKVFTINNLGERNMALGGVTVPAGFTLVTPPADNNLAPGASTTFTLRMEAGAAGSPSGIVRFGVDSQDSNPFNFTVSGVIQDSMIVDNGDLGYNNSGPWEVREATTVFNYFQDDSDLLPEGSGGGNTASWTFTDLGAGTYQVASTWSAHSALASNAVVTISGIEGGPFTGSLDQRFSPNDFNADGTDWEELGLFQVAAGGTLTVTLDDTGADGIILADAVRLELVPIGSLAPEIEVGVGGTDLVSGAGSVDFGTAFFGESVFQTVTVTNSGTTTLNLGAIATPAGFAVSTPPGDTTLAAGQSTTFVLEFNSTGAAGPYAGPVTIANDDANENPFVINVTANMSTSSIIDDGDTGFSSSGDFFNFGSPFYYGADSQRLNNGGTGTATWEFTALPAGIYQVAATWDGHPSRDSDVDFNVASSGSGGGAASVNQQVSPADFVADGAAWGILGTVTIGAGGSITVTLTDTATASSILADAIRIERTGPLVAAGGVSSTVAPSITQSDLDSVLDAALSFWEAAGLSEEQLSLLDSVSFVLSDLPDATLGLATSTTVLIDINAAGYGWFVDDTPFDSSEYSLDSDGNLVADESSEAFGRMDLLTVVMHELGHTLGLDHGDEDSLMGESLDNSERHLPEIDDFFSAMSGGDNPLLD